MLALSALLCGQEAWGQAKGGAAPKGSAAPTAAETAEPAPPPPAEDTSGLPPDHPKALYIAGNELADQGKWAEAEEKYLAAWKQQKSYDLAANLGIAEINLEKFTEAAGFLAYALRTFPQGGKEEKRAVVEQKLVEAKQKVGTIQIALKPADAEVLIDRKPIDREVMKDDIFAAPGDRLITVQKSGYKPFEQKIRIVEASVQKLTITLEEPKRNALPAYVIGGAGVVLLGVGAALYGVSEGQAGEARAAAEDLRANHGNELPCPEKPSDATPNCKKVFDLATSSDSLHNGGVAAMVVGGIAVAGGVAYFIWAQRPGSASTTATQRGPRVTAIGVRGPTGIVVQGSF